jgi:DNA-binding NarL/FixJ family response regulator
MVRLQQAPVRVLIAGRNPAWTAGMAAFLSGPELEAGTAVTVDGALGALDAAPHHLLVVGRALRDAPGSELAREVARRHPGVIVVVALDDGSPEAQLEALAAGAAGCIPPDAGREAVAEAVSDALRPLADLMRRTGPREVLLTEQERVVLRLMRQHLTYKEIAQRLGVSWHTVRTHAQSILRKSGVHSRRDLAAWDQRLDAAEGLPAGAATEAAR